MQYKGICLSNIINNIRTEYYERNEAHDLFETLEMVTPPPVIENTALASKEISEEYLTDYVQNIIAESKERKRPLYVTRRLILNFRDYIKRMIH